MSFASGQAVRDAVLIRKFGELHDYTAVGQGTVSVTGVFEIPTRQSQAGNRAVSAQFPMISALKSEVSNLTKGDHFTINGTEYRVKEPGKDEGEVVTAKLEAIK